MEFLNNLIQKGGPVMHFLLALGIQLAEIPAVGIREPDFVIGGVRCELCDPLPRSAR